MNWRPMRIAWVSVLTVACGPSGHTVDDTAGGESVGDESVAAVVPAGLSGTLEAGITELYRLANGARFMAGKARQEECDCWPPEIELLNDSGLELVDLEPRTLAETLQKMVDALEPLRGRSPFGALADAFEAQIAELLARQGPFEASELLTQATAALQPIRAAITAEAAMAPTEPVLCSAALRLSAGQLQLWELELMRVVHAAELAGDEEAGMRVLGIIELSRRHFEALSVGVEEGPRSAVPAIREKLVFFRSFDSVFDRGDDEAVLTATADLCEPLAVE